MEMLDGSRWPICAWETSSMEENSYCPCCSGEEERLHRQDTLIQLFRRREKRLTRMAQFLTVALLLVISAALALLITSLLRWGAPETPDSQRMMHPERHSSDTSVKQQKQEIEDTPSAMLTALNGNNAVVEYLEWQSELGNAHCKGGFNYSSGNLVVPRSGRYKIYLQITYESDSNKCNGHDEMRLINTVFVYQEAYRKDIPLLSSVDTVNCSMKYWIKSLHTDGSFVLEANSRLKVTSSNPELIYKREDLTFFGAELLTVF